MGAKPQVFKMGGSWIWQCAAHSAGPVGDSFPEAAWRSAWDACLGAAVKHAVSMHERRGHTVLPDR
jgi:hypothetical protein